MSFIIFYIIYNFGEIYFLFTLGFQAEDKLH